MTNMKEANLSAPLLAGNQNNIISLESSYWPKDEADRAKLYIPIEYDPYQDENDPRQCILRFDEERKLFVFVSCQNTEDIVDIIDPEDIIGAAVEVKLLGPCNEPRSVAAARGKHFRNCPTHPDPTHPEGPSSPADCGIFKPLGDNIDKVFAVSTDDNEPTTDIAFDTQAVAVLSIYAYPRLNIPSTQISCGQRKPKPITKFPDLSAGGDKEMLPPRQAHHRRFQVTPAEDFSDIATVVRAIRKLSRPSLKSDRLLVIVNPTSGLKKGEYIYKTIVAPMFDQAGVDHDILITKHAGHAEERMLGPPSCSPMQDVSEYDGIVAIGGDGVVHEILQGIRKRPDCDQILKKLKLGHIGAGTSNGLAKSLAHAAGEQHTPTDYAFVVAKGKTGKMDLSRFQTASNSYLSFLTFSWSIIADVDIESEALRWMGRLRYDLWGVWRIINLRTYRARFSYLPPSFNSKGTNLRPVNELPPLQEPIPEGRGWVTIEDNFVFFWATQVTHTDEKVYIAPQCKPNDGVFFVLVIRQPVSRFQLAKVLLALDSGRLAEINCVEIIECIAYRLDPISPGSFNDLDGEVIESGPIQGTVLPGAIQAYYNK